MKKFFNEYLTLKTTFQDKLCPKQEYFSDYKKLKEWLRANKSHAKNVLLIYDGTFKKHSPIDPKELLKYFLSEILPCENLLILKDVLTKKEEIGANQENLQVLKRLLNSKSNYDSIIGLGSGVLIDLIKHACFETSSKAKLISIPTALSVSAYTSKISIISKNGLKESLSSRLPDTVLWVEPLLRAAPLNYTQSGFGDILCIPYAQSDWLLSSIIGFQKFSPKYIHVFNRYKNSLSKYASEYSKPTPSKEATNFLSFMISLAGLFMTDAGGSWPVSGYEHAISHTLDFIKDLSFRAKILHGQQVALTSYSSACLFEWFLSYEMPHDKSFHTLDEKALRKFLLKLLQSFPIFDKGSLDFSQQKKETNYSQLQDLLEKNLPSLTSNFRQKQELWQSYVDSKKIINFEDIKSTINDFIYEKNEFERMLNAASLPLIPEDTKPQTLSYEYRWALRFAPFVRGRFCLGDLIFWMGQDPCHLLGI